MKIKRYDLSIGLVQYGDGAVEIQEEECTYGEYVKSPDVDILLKRIKELEKQNKSLRNCRNCHMVYYIEDKNPCDSCINFSNWKAKSKLMGCKDCGGTGQLLHFGKCAKCRGTGVVNQETLKESIEDESI